MPIFVNLMRRSALGAGFALGLASCGVSPAFAQAESCHSLETVASEAAEVAAQGAEVHTLVGDEAAAAMAFLEQQLGPWQRPVRPTSLIIAIGPHAGLVAFGEGTQVCLMLPMPREIAVRVVKAAKGQPA